MPQMFGILASFISSWGELKMYELIFYLNLYSAIWSSSDWGLDDWQVGWNNWETATIMPIIGCILPLYLFPSFLHLFLCTKRLQLCSRLAKHRPVHIFVFFSFLWFCHSEVHLSEEKPAELAVASLGPVGDCLCSDVDVLYRTSGSIRLSVLNNF